MLLCGNHLSLCFKHFTSKSYSPPQFFFPVTKKQNVFREFSHVKFEKRYCYILSLPKQFTALETLKFDIIFSPSPVVFLLLLAIFFLMNFSQVKLEKHYSMNFFVSKRSFVSLNPFESISYSLPNFFCSCPQHSNATF